MKTFTQILDTFRRDSRSEHDKGFRFERLMQAYLKTTALYANLFEEVWLWADFPYHAQFGWHRPCFQDLRRRVLGHSMQMLYSQ